MTIRRGLGPMGADARMRGYLGMGLRNSVMPPMFKGEPALKWIITRLLDTGDEVIAGVCEEACEDAAIEIFDANVAAAGGDSAHMMLVGVVGVGLSLILTDDSGTQHDRQPVETWKASR